jgi:hypothetical protein
MPLLHNLALVAVTLYGWAVPLYELRRRQAQDALNTAKNPKSRDTDTPKGKVSHKEKTESCSDGSRVAQARLDVSKRLTSELREERSLLVL